MWEISWNHLVQQNHAWCSRPRLYLDQSWNFGGTEVSNRIVWDIITPCWNISTQLLEDRSGKLISYKYSITSVSHLLHRTMKRSHSGGAYWDGSHHLLDRVWISNKQGKGQSLYPFIRGAINNHVWVLACWYSHLRHVSLKPRFSNSLQNIRRSNNTVRGTL